MTAPTSTPNFGFPCPSGDSMADLGLHMQNLAKLFDDQGHTQQEALLAALNRPTAIWSMSADVVSTGGAFLGMNFDQLLFSNYANALASNSPLLPVGYPGIYKIGFCGQVIQAATVVAGQSRNGYIQVTNVGQAGHIFTYDSPFFSCSTVETNTGGEDLLVEGTFVLPEFKYSPSLGGCEAWIEVGYRATLGGGGGNVSLKAGTRLYLMYLSAGDQVEVVS
jgi:hypothetical protein